MRMPQRQPERLVQHRRKSPDRRRYFRMVWQIDAPEGCEVLAALLFLFADSLMTTERGENYIRVHLFPGH